MIRRGANAALEQLEPRIVLSDVYYAWTGLETLPGFAAEYGEPAEVEGVSDDGAFVWSGLWAAGGKNAAEPYVVEDGHVTYLRDIPALAGTDIAGINSSGIVLGAAGDDPGRAFLYDLRGTGDREYLDELGLEAPPEFDIADAAPVFITDGGGIVLSTDADPQGEAEQWIVTDGAVTHLWRGFVTDVNASDWVAGYQDGPKLQTTGHASLLLWRPGVGLEDLGAQGLNTNSPPGANIVTNDGIVLGVDDDRRLVAWESGLISPLGVRDQLPIRDPDGASDYTPMGQTGAGVVAVYEYWQQLSDPWIEETFILHPDRAVHLQTANDGRDLAFRATESGVLLGGDRELISGHYSGRGAGWWSEVDHDAFVATRADEAATIWMEDGRLQVLTRTANGERMWFDLQPDGSFTSSFDGPVGFDSEPWRREAIADPATGKVLALTLFGKQFRAIDPWVNEGSFPDTYSDLYDRAFLAITGFFDEYSRPVVAGLTTGGQLLMRYSEPDSGSHSGYDVRTTNLSTDHLASRGLDTPAFVGTLDSFRTTWGARNIIGLDADGQVQAVWWSPGLGSALWTTSNLSAITGAPRLVGSVTATETPWGGMQIHGTDERGNLLGLWWSPQTHQWRVTDLTAMTGGMALEAGSIEVAAGRFGGITTFAKSAEGDVVCYWWSAQQQTWEAQSMTEEAGADMPAMTGPLSRFVARSGEQHVTGVDGDGHVLDLYWKPDGHGWQWRDLTVLAGV